MGPSVLTMTLWGYFHLSNLKHSGLENKASPPTKASKIMGLVSPNTSAMFYFYRPITKLCDVSGYLYRLHMG